MRILKKNFQLINPRVKADKNSKFEQILFGGFGEEAAHLRKYFSFISVTPQYFGKKFSGCNLGLMCVKFNI